MSATFYYLSPPVLAAGAAIIVIHAETTDEPPTVLFDDEPGDEHQVSADLEGATPEEQADGGAKALICSIAARRNIALAPADVTRIPKP